MSGDEKDTNKKVIVVEEVTEPEMTPEQAKDFLWRKGELVWKLKGKQKDIYNHFKYNKNNDDLIPVLISRQFGKCVAEGTLIPTTKGMKPIEEIEIGDYVYGYNEEGIIEPTKVLQKHNQGIKEVYDLVHNTKVYATVTEDHRFLVHNTATDKEEVKSVKEMYGHEKIRREFIQTSCGEIHEPQAYAVGALLGDGCSKQGIKSIHISGADEEIVLKVKQQLNADYHYKQNESNYTWVISNNKKLKRRGYSGHREERPLCALYEEWCDDRYAHEKIVDLEIVKKWDRESCLQFLAGIIDTDGHVGVCNNILKVAIYNQSKSMLEACRFLLQQLFFVDAKIYEDKRDKYKNGNVFFIQVNNNLYSKMIVRELDKYLQVPRKKWKEEYSFLIENNTNSKFLGVKKQNKRKSQCWDIGIDNRTHLYLMENGLITHNSFTMCLLAIETCLSKPGAIVKYVCPTSKMVLNVMVPRVRDIIIDCPEDVKPKWSPSERKWLFPNGSEIQVAGTDNGNYDSIRGGSADLCIADEGAFMTELEEIVFNVLAPTTDTTGGKIYLASTPNPRDANHAFHELFVHPYEASGSLLRMTWLDSPMVKEEDRRRIPKRYPGGEDNIRFRCEYLCEIPQVTENNVIPEFVKVEKDIVKEVEKPEFCDFYTSMDIGFRDLTVILFGYYDFLEGALVIMDEYIINGPDMKTDKLREEIQKNESIYFRTNNISCEAKLRVMDNNNLLLVQDLSRSGLRFLPTQKHDKENEINKLRMRIENKKLIIHPRCKNLIYHVKNAQWQYTRAGTYTGRFKHMKGHEEGGLLPSHADALDALIYMHRNLMLHANPFPKDHGHLRGQSVHQSIHSSDSTSESAEIMSNILNLRKKRRNN